VARGNPGPGGKTPTKNFAGPRNLPLGCPPRTAKERKHPPQTPKKKVGGVWGVCGGSNPWPMPLLKNHGAPGVPRKRFYEKAVPENPKLGKFFGGGFFCEMENHFCFVFLGGLVVLFFVEGCKKPNNQPKDPHFKALEIWGGVGPRSPTQKKKKKNPPPPRENPTTPPQNNPGGGVGGGVGG